MELVDLVLDLLSLAAVLYCVLRLRGREEPLPEVVDEPEPVEGTFLENVERSTPEPEPAAVEVAPYKVEPAAEIEPETTTTVWPEPPALEVLTGCAVKGHTWQLRGEEETQGHRVRIYRCLHCPDKLREEADL